VDVADTEPAREQGLMHRAHLGRFDGMLFVFEHPAHVRFWMKDTPILLDMIFADRSGRVTRVHPDAIPESLTPIDGGAAVLYVLEINGGMAARLGIAPGSELRSLRIDPDLAAWPCD